MFWPYPDLQLRSLPSFVRTMPSAREVVVVEHPYALDFIDLSISEEVLHLFVTCFSKHSCLDLIKIDVFYGIVTQCKYFPRALLFGAQKSWEKAYSTLIKKRRSGFRIAAWLLQRFPIGTQSSWNHFPPQWVVQVPLVAPQHLHSCSFASSRSLAIETNYWALLGPTSAVSFVCT